jgi:hypothetical protein
MRDQNLVDQLLDAVVDPRPIGAPSPVTGSLAGILEARFHSRLSSPGSGRLTLRCQLGTGTAKQELRGGGPGVSAGGHQRCREPAGDLPTGHALK